MRNIYIFSISKNIFSFYTHNNIDRIIDKCYKELNKGRFLNFNKEAFLLEKPSFIYCIKKSKPQSFYKQTNT